MALESQPIPGGRRHILLLIMAQHDIDDVRKWQAIGFGGVLNREYVAGLADHSFCKEKAHCQFLIVSRGAHYDGEAALVDTHFKWLLNGEVILALLSLVALPVGCAHVHYALRVERGTPESWYCHEFLPSIKGNFACYEQSYETSIRYFSAS